jgi:hypothetical protein
MRWVRGRSVDERDSDDWSRNSNIDDTAARTDSCILSGSHLQHAEDKFQANIAREHDCKCCTECPEDISPSGTDTGSCQSNNELANTLIYTTRPPPARSHLEAWFDGFCDSWLLAGDPLP